MRIWDSTPGNEAFHLWPVNPMTLGLAFQPVPVMLLVLLIQ